MKNHLPASRKSRPSPRLTKSAWTAAAAAAAACLIATTASAAGHQFSFRSIEFMPEDERQPAAEAFVAQNIHPGMDLPSALKVLRRSGLYCHTRSRPIECVHGSFERRPGEDMKDIFWRVDVSLDAGGLVQGAKVTRDTHGV